MEEKNTTLKEVVLDRSYHKKDNTVTITFITTREQSDDQFMSLHKMRNTTGMLCFYEGTDIPKAIPEAISEANITPKTKSKSQRLRGGIWSLWTKLSENNQTQLTEEEYYNARMEGFIATIKRDKEEL